ncbi:arabinan endo-1,5-alpha-L-arabinosidase [Gracilibacillus massiliensis]|uniref:arabinan endo-1,5-alpha-L-arabinosidase n=1 Tax=Gracilibacillus massiliensis TaxID=1564956 RepID=UPI00071C4475|nr:arabinan endo-1,5-alpha-L-arabinosidase [Gracilibacillus massiliensis]
MIKKEAWISIIILISIVVIININHDKLSGLFNGSSDTLLDMRGEIGDFNESAGIDDPVHDPSIFKENENYFVVSTGAARNNSDPGGIFMRKSTEDVAGPWQSIGEIEVPEWAKEFNVAHLWAPHVVEQNGVFYLYYAVSIFGTNESSIGVASTTTPSDLASWEDHGPIITSVPGQTEYNAIDPMVFEADGTWWMVFGSHFGGIFVQELTDNLVEPIGEVNKVASRQSKSEHNAIEGPTIFERNGYYYLLTSWDKCCDGLDSTYKVAVGRSESVTGPYLDSEGNELLEGGGDVILESIDNHIGPGGQDILEEEDKYYMVYHYYDGDADGTIRMQIREINWQNNWPTFQ